MSKYARIKTSFTDGKLLIEALAAVGMRGIQNHIGNPQHLEGFEASRRQETADIIIPRRYVGNSSNDLGFKRDSKGKYEAIISDFDSRRYGTEWQQKLSVEYNQADLNVKMKKLGYKLVNTGLNQTNGNRKLAYQQI